MHESESRLDDQRWNDRLDEMVDQLNSEAEAHEAETAAAWDQKFESMAAELAQLDGGD